MIVPAVLPKSRSELEEKLAILAQIPQVTRIQIDVVDGNYAAPASWPYNAPGDLEAMAAAGEILPFLDRIEYEIDLMCFDAAEAAGKWLALGATRLTFHAASVSDPSRFLFSMQDQYGAAGALSYGLALNASTPFQIVEPCLPQVSYVQFMGIKTIGRQGEPFDERVLARIKAFHARHPHTELQVDGGVSLTTAPALIAAGVSNLIVGSAIVRAPDPAAAFAAFEAL